METKSPLCFWSLVHLLGVSWQKDLVYYPHPFFDIVFNRTKARHKNRKGSVIWMAGDCSTVKRWQWRAGFHLHLHITGSQNGQVGWPGGKDLPAISSVFPNGRLHVYYEAITWNRVKSVWRFWKPAIVLRSDGCRRSHFKLTQGLLL